MNWDKEFIKSWWSWRRYIDKTLEVVDPSKVDLILQRLVQVETEVNILSATVNQLNTKVQELDNIVKNLPTDLSHAVIVNDTVHGLTINQINRLKESSNT